MSASKMTTKLPSCCGYLEEPSKHLPGNLSQLVRRSLVARPTLYERACRLADMTPASDWLDSADRRLHEALSLLLTWRSSITRIDEGGLTKTQIPDSHIAPAWRIPRSRLFTFRGQKPRDQKALSPSARNCMQTFSTFSEFGG
jgi:hypothetical protein